MSRRAWLLFATMCIIWGLPYLMIRVAVGALHPVTLVFFRTGLAGLLLLPIAAARDELRPLLRRWAPLLAYTVAEISVPWLLLSSAEQRVSSSLSALMIAAVPLVTAILLREHLGGRRLLGLGIGFAGVAALVGLDASGVGLRPLLELAGVVLGYALGPIILSRRLADLPSLGVVTASLLLAAVAYAPAAALALPASLPPARVLLSVVGLAVVCTAVGFVVFFALIAEIGPVRATVITYINPAVATVLGVVLLREPLTAGMVSGFVLVIAGSLLATRRQRPRPALAA
ncbi:MAG TPA: DMT family transporter [Candidatus Dormibacteraeota bacterium]|nr:DMT family transporter [Candidatus Dormibacteraeota bacterium]